MRDRRPANFFLFGSISRVPTTGTALYLPFHVLDAMTTCESDHPRDSRGDLYHATQARKDLLDGQRATAFRVSDVNPDIYPQSEEFRKRFVDDLLDLTSTPLAGLQEIEDIMFSKGCLWIIFVKARPFSKDEVLQLQKGLATIITKYKYCAPIFAFAKEPQYTHMKDLPARILNLAALGRHIVLQDTTTAMENKTSGRASASRCICLEASELSNRLTSQQGVRVRVFDRGTEKRQGWLSGTKSLRFIAEQLEATSCRFKTHLSPNFINMYLQICGKEWSEDDLQILRLVNYLVHPTSWICDPTDTDRLLLQRNDVLKPKTLLRYLFREVQAGMTQSNVEQ